MVPLFQLRMATDFSTYKIIFFYHAFVVVFLVSNIKEIEDRMMGAETGMSEIVVYCVNIMMLLH